MRACCAGVSRARRSNVQFDVEASPIVGEGSLKSTSWARKPTSNRSTFDVERSPDLQPTDHAGVQMQADKQYQEEQASHLQPAASPCSATSEGSSAMDVNVSALCTLLVDGASCGLHGICMLWHLY